MFYDILKQFFQLKFCTNLFTSLAAVQFGFADHNSKAYISKTIHPL